ncbi:hypothetical protein T12_1304 [Trichinella patagoniensis]|uniref:Uncharacterized protein n=1 Tax=Trichinella patagoniensis TaxID=990121 RepID=A0A0V0ZG95_9BILA|nr:hypothetical protein T12_1304 [Trichinella patagoniensis]
MSRRVLASEYPICSGELPLLASLQPVCFASQRTAGFLLVVLRNVRLNKFTQQSQMTVSVPMSGLVRLICSADKFTLFYRFELINLQRGRSRKLAIHPINEWFKNRKWFHW